MQKVFEPYRIKAVERLRVTTRSERERLIADAGYNVARLRSGDVLLDLLTDSGTSAMSSEQWAALQRGDESYVNSPSYDAFQAAVRRVSPFKHVIPTHQGRAAERLLASAIGRVDALIPSNSHFDTTRGNFAAMGATPLDLALSESRDPYSAYPFKGDMDTGALAKLLEQSAERIPLVMLTITSNAVGGHPVSLTNIRNTSALCRARGVPLFLDACRFAENSYLVKSREPELAGMSLVEIVRETFACADGVVMSAKKDALSCTGGWVALNDDALAEKIIELLVLTEGFPTHGGLCGRDLEAMAVGLEEALDEHHLQYRIQSIARLGEQLSRLGVPLFRPFGGHALYLDAAQLLPHIPSDEHPGQALVVALYERGGIRACEVGSARLHAAARDGSESKAAVVRLAIPRRVYTQSHLEHVASVFEEIVKAKAALSGLRAIAAGGPLQHYAAQFEPVRRARAVAAPAGRAAVTEVHTREVERAR